MSAEEQEWVPGVGSRDPKDPSFAGPCPRCGGPVPNVLMCGEYPGALSRVDNATYICSQCGTDEAMFNFAHSNMDLPPLDERVRL